MKKVTIIFALMFSILSFAQDKSNRKFQFGISYSFTNDDNLYNKPLSFYVNYQLKKIDKIEFRAELKSYYFSSKNSTNFTNKLGFNPNVTTSYYFLNGKMSGYFGLGYYFDSSTFKPTSTGFFTSPNQTIKTNGLTFAPGLKYFVHPNIFIDTNVTFLLAKTKFESGTSDSNNNTFFNIGVGASF
ncbi:hypothetical protein [Flavobacterium sp.]|jgi:hypothetical protein|uniref:hypothetical protein n=1 Tax=Flavobacterium sp. TaxID=239 RepID=UPI0037C036AE